MSAMERGRASFPCASSSSLWGGRGPWTFLAVSLLCLVALACSWVRFLSPPPHPRLLPLSPMQLSSGAASGGAAPEAYLASASMHLGQCPLVQACKASHSLGVGPTLSPQKPVPIYLLALGIEGSGHHVLRFILSDVVDEYVKYKGELHMTKLKAQGQKVDQENWHRLEQDSHAVHWTNVTAQYQAVYNRFKEKWKGYTSTWQPGKERFVFYDVQHSCPMGGFRGPWDCPDVLNFIAMDRRGLIDLRVLALTRPIVDSFMSSMRRFAKPHTSIDRELHLWDLMMKHMQVSIQSLPCDKVLFLPFNYVLSKPPELAKLLANFIGKPSAAANISANMDTVIQPQPQSASSKFGRLPLECSSKGLTGDACKVSINRMAAQYFGERECAAYPCWADRAECSM